MSYFNITIEKILSSEPIADTDRLDLTKLDGIDFQFVTGRGQYKTGDTVLYFPVDSVLPLPIQEQLGVVGKLSGNKKDRLRTVRLRGQISQGIVGPLSIIKDLVNPTPEEITLHLGVVKYEPPTIEERGAQLKRLPGNLTIYDIEGCERNMKVLELIMDLNVWILEKMEGQNASVLYVRSEEKTYVNQRRHTIEELPESEHYIWALARRDRLTDFVKWASDKTGQDVAVYFEMCGLSIQGNIYKLTKATGYIFDIKVGENFISKSDMLSMLDEFLGIGSYTTAPILCAGDKTLRDWLQGRTIKEASNGNSMIHPVLREGIVIVPAVEQPRVHLQGRLILKQRDPVYLLGTDT